MIKAAPGPLGQCHPIDDKQIKNISTEWFGTSRARSAVIHAISVGIEDSTPGRHDAYSSARLAVGRASETEPYRSKIRALVAITPRKTALFEIPIPDRGCGSRPMCSLDVEVSQSDGTRNERLNWLKLVSTELAAAKKSSRWT